MHERQIVYRGRCDRSADRCIITVYRSLRIGGTRIYELPARNDVMNHSPDGFSWGYQGSGPAQAALAILLDFTDGDVARVQPIYQFFKDVVIANFENGSSWELTAGEIERTLATIEREQQRAS